MTDAAIRTDGTHRGVIGRIAAHLRRLTRERSGASAIEFAFLAPILIAIYISSFEITTGYSVSQKT